MESLRLSVEELLSCTTMNGTSLVDKVSARLLLELQMIQFLLAIKNISNIHF